MRKNFFQFLIIALALTLIIASCQGGQPTADEDPPAVVGESEVSSEPGEEAKVPEEAAPEDRLPVEADDDRDSAAPVRPRDDAVHDQHLAQRIATFQNVADVM